MAIPPWKAPADVQELVNAIKEEHHHPRLEQANICVAFEDSKPFKNDTLNLGKTVKFTPLNKIWHLDPHDFCIIIPVDVWQNILDDHQKRAYIDLRLTMCQVEYEPQTVVENNKTIKIKDDFGRIQYTDQIKYDDEGNPKWKKGSLNLMTFSQNVKRYGLWYSDLMEFKQSIPEKE